jgi:hypothetical protein
MALAACGGFLLSLRQLAPASARVPQSPYQPNAAPDLVPFVEWSPQNPTVSDTLVITYGIINIGDAPASPSNVIEARLYFGVAFTPTVATSHSHTGGTALSVAPNQRRTLGVVAGILAVTSTQDTPVWVWADFAGDVAESNESNNLTRWVMQAPRPPEIDAYENDSGCLQAKPALMNAPQARTLWPVGDEDWVTFVADSNRKYTVDVRNNGADTAVFISVLMSCNAATSVASSSVALITGTQVTWDALVTGPVYVRLTHRQSTHGPNTAYTLTVKSSDICFSEPNNTCHTASPLVVGANLSRQGNFCERSDLDWYVFDARAGVSYDISIGSNASAVNPELAGLELDSCGDVPVFNGGDRYVHQADHDGPVHVLIQNVATGFGPSENYVITVTVAGCATDAAEPNDVANAARQINVNQAINANGCPANDHDWYAFAAAANTTYYIETLPNNLDETQSDTQLVVYDSDTRTVLKSDDDSGPGLGARTEVRLPSARVLYVLVTQADSTRAGPSTQYALSVRTTPCAADIHEPNNTSSAAIQLISGTTSAHTLCPAQDEDHFVFNVPPGRYALATSDLGVAADTTLTLYDATGAWLGENDDYQPKGLGSRLVFSATQAQTFRAVVRPRLAANLSSGVQYSLTLRAHSPLIVEDPNPDNILVSPPLLDSGIATLIVTNRAQLAALYGGIEADAVMAKLDALKNHPRVRGEVLDVDLNATVRAAYADWAANPTSNAHAAAVARTIRNLIVNDIAQRTTIQYLVIVGDDRVVPFHRLPDASIGYPESTYTYTLASTSVGVAQRANTLLTDDCYSAAQLLQRARQNWCVPLLATGRLVETPSEISNFIDLFLTNSLITPVAPHMALVGGYDFVEDSARDTCEKLQFKFGRSNVNCSLIGNFAPLADYQALALRSVPPFMLHSFHGHGTHFAMGMNKLNQVMTAEQIAAEPSAPGLVWTPACHVGLNVPDALDMAQAYARRGANLIANTGYGWGTSGGTAYSEYMAQYLVNAFVSANDVQIGQALRRAKWKYYAQQRGDDVIHPKVAMEMTLYGLPMYTLHSASSSSSASLLQPEQGTNEVDEDAFPSVTVSTSQTIGFSGDLLSSSESVSLDPSLLPSAVLSRQTNVSGTHFSLDGRVAIELGASIQPRFYYALNRPNADKPARAAWVLSATYEVVQAVTTTAPVVTNEYGIHTLAQPSDAWDNSDVVAVRALPERDTLVIAMGQGNPAARRIRLTKAMSVEVYYSKQIDIAAPQLVSIAITRTGVMHGIKVKLTDSNMLIRVGVLYSNGLGAWRSQDLSFDVDEQSWLGAVTEPGDVSFAVQALDSAGNVGRFTNKGRYYTAAPDSPLTPSPAPVYLPFVAR